MATAVELALLQLAHEVREGKGLSVNVLNGRELDAHKGQLAPVHLLHLLDLAQPPPLSLRRAAPRSWEARPKLLQKPLGRALRQLLARLPLQLPLGPLCVHHHRRAPRLAHQARHLPQRAMSEKFKKAPPPPDSAGARRAAHLAPRAHHTHALGLHFQTPAAQQRRSPVCASLHLLQRVRRRQRSNKARTHTSSVRVFEGKFPHSTHYC